MHRMTEDAIERKVERMMEKLDWRLIIDNSLTQAQYDREVKALDAWAKKQYSERRH